MRESFAPVQRNAMLNAPARTPSPDLQSRTFKWPAATAADPERVLSVQLSLHGSSAFQWRQCFLGWTHVMSQVPMNYQYSLFFESVSLTTVVGFCRSRIPKTVNPKTINNLFFTKINVKSLQRIICGRVTSKILIEQR